ncbi:MAG: carboxypeptidase regulatory-like domain-containing protein [Actinobacteria bacterium]|nr:carboxypeptidase regulatory-like domain-containing protein [Actinomycetota bacterium]
MGKAEEPGGLSGTVTAEGSAVDGVNVCVYGSGDLSSAIECKLTGSTGGYEFTGLAAGQYVVEFVPSAEYFTQWYSGAGSAVSATPVLVAAEAVTSGVDAALVKKPPSGPGAISGKVTAAEGGQAVGNVKACAEMVGGGTALCATTSETGEYEITGVAAGQYMVEFAPPAPAEYFTQWYSGAASADRATPVLVAAGTVAPGVDASLIKVPPPGPGAIKGTVTAEKTGQPVTGVEVCGEQMGVVGTFCDTTEATGGYEIGGLTAGQYTVKFSPPADYFTQWYSGASSAAGATAISVAAGATTSGIDAVLQKPPSGPGSISGTVTAADTELPVPGVKVCATQVGVTGSRCETTGTDGKYGFPELPAGQWLLTFAAQGTSRNLLSLSYPNKEIWETPEPVTLSAGGHGTVNAKLKTGGQISGTVRVAATGTPVAGVRVCLTEANVFGSLACLTTPTSGAYRFIAVWPGSFKVVFSAAPGEFPDATPIVDTYSTQWWAGQPTYATASPITVFSGANIAAIDASLALIPGPVTDPPATTTTASVPAPAGAVAAVKKVSKPLKCKKGFAKRKVKGKARCVKLKKHVKKSKGKHKKHGKKSA